MHPTSTNSNNVEQYYHTPTVSTLRRASRPSNIDLSILESNHNQQTNDPGIYSAPIYYVKQPNHQQQTHIQQTSHPYTASFQYQQPPIEIQSLNPNLSIYRQQQQQQQSLLDPYSQHTPHTFPLQGSPNHYNQYFCFPPSNVQHDTTVTNGNHQLTVPQNDRLRPVQPQQWSNPVLNPLMVKRINENAASMSIDDDDDPSASIDALVADDDSSSQDLLDDQQDKSLDQTKNPSATTTDPISPTPHLYLRSTSHILTTPPNPLASNDHPDNQLTVNPNFQKTFSPIPSAGFELTNSNGNVQITTTKTNTNTSYFTFDTKLSDQTKFQSTQDETTDDERSKPLIINTDTRTPTTNENKTHASTNTNGQHAKSRIYSQIAQNSDQQRTSPLLNDIKSSSIDRNSNSPNLNRHLCTHPDCNKAFANKSALAKHKLTHSQDRKHKCPKCNKGFKRLDHLHGHMLTHEEDKPHKCRVPTCNRTYCDARSLKRHIENTHQDVLAAIHDGTHNEYRKYLPETATVKTKDLTINNDFSIDSIDSNSPHSLGENEQSFNIRTTTGTKVLTTYTFDEEKCVECHICKKPFKNGAALNGHMRLHGGFNDKQTSPHSNENVQQKKKSTSSKRKRTQSPMTIKNEEQDMSTNFYSIPSTANLQQYSPVRLRSISSTVPSRTYAHVNIDKPLSVQSMNNSGMFDVDKYGKTFSSDDFYSTRQQINGHSSPPTNYSRTSSQQHSMYCSLPMNSSNAVSQTLIQQLLRQRAEMLNANAFYSNQISDEQTRYTSSPNFTHSPIPTANTLPYPSHVSPISNMPNGTNPSVTPNSMEPSPVNQSTSLSSCSSSSLSSNVGPKKRFLSGIKHESDDDKHLSSNDDERTVIPPTSTLIIIPDVDSPTKKNLSGFLIGTPSSTGASSSSSTSSHTHFNYDHIQIEKKRESTPSSFQWPSQFRRQLSLNVSNTNIDPIPTTPYTPPPMLSPFRKGPGLYYRVFSHPGTTTDVPSIPTTPSVDEIANPKINIGRDYQACIPKYRADSQYSDDESRQDELLFSPTDLPELDEQALDKFEQLNRMNPYLFSPRNCSTFYSIELIYMLLYEYSGNLQRTISALLQGTINDIKQCRPIHRYRFSECDHWTSNEIEIYSKTIQNSEKNFEHISRTIGTKTIKQCIEFHYMPKVNLTSRKVYPIGTSTVVTRRKRVQLTRTKFDDETSSPSPCTEFRFDDDSDSASSAQYTCDVDACSRIFTSERACRAHRKQHRRTATTKRK